jgi:hypothetical protein
MKQFYLQHHIQQVSGFINIAEYACNSIADVERKTIEITTRHPTDAACFCLRVVNHTVSHSLD